MDAVQASTDPFRVPVEFALRALANTPGDEINVRYLGGDKKPLWLYMTWDRERAAGMIRDADGMRWDFLAEGGFHLRMDYIGREYWVKLIHPPVPPLPSPTPPPAPESEPEPEPDPEPPVVPEPEDPPADPEPDPQDPPAEPEQPGNN